MDTMNVKAIVICLLISQTSASFFDEFRGAMYSVEDSFEKLLGDVVSDVRETIGCTILAVKQVLALGGVFDESSDYDTRCKSQSDSENSYVQEKQDNNPPDPPIIIPPIPESGESINEKTLSERLSEEINVSIASAHDKVMNIIEGHDTETKIDEVKSKLENEGKRLMEISSLLHHELNNISEDVKKELSRVEIDYFHPTVEGIWHDVKVLHEIEQKYEGTDDANEIHHILDQVLGVLRGSSTQDIETLPATSNDADADKTFALIENQFEIMEKEENIESASEHTQIPEESVETRVEESVSKEVEDIPLTFKDVAKRIMDETRQSFRFADNSPQEYEKLEPVTTEKIQITTEKPSDDATISPDYGAFFQIASSDSKSRKKVVEEATSLIESSKKSDAIINSYFNKAENVGSSVFDNPELLGFG